MDHLRRLGNRISVRIPADGNRFTGRKCPQPDCEGYFKIELGTGLKGEALPCHCPYCGHAAGHDQFWTKEQIKYAKSVAMRRITDAFHEDLKELEFDDKPKGAFGIGLSLTGGFVSDGPYRFTRNPQYVGDIVFFIGVGVIANAVFLWIAHLLLALVFVVAPLTEESWLEEQYGDAYREYQTRVPRFL